MWKKDFTYFKLLISSIFNHSQQYKLKQKLDTIFLPSNDFRIANNDALKKAFVHYS